MATGAPGTNGVWQYGEDDSEATFSALLNKAAGTTDTAIGLDRARLTTLEARKLSGLVPVVPSSIAQGSGSASFNSTTGLVTFTGVNSISLNGIFTSAYRDYEILIDITTTSGSSGDLSYRLRSAGTDRTTSNYYTSGSYHTAGGLTGQYYANAVNRADLGYIVSNASEAFTASSLQVIEPYNAIMTKFRGHSNGLTTSQASFHQTGALHNLGQSHDGITFIGLAGTLMTGTLKAYGYN